MTDGDKDPKFDQEQGETESSLSIETFTVAGQIRKEYHRLWE